MKNTRFFVMALLWGALAGYVGYSINHSKPKPNTLLPCNLSLDFVGLKSPESNGEVVDISHIKFENEGHRLYQFHGDDKIGCILRYIISSTDPEKPLAYVSEVQRDEKGYVELYKQHDLFLKVKPNNPQWKFAWARGLYTEHWDSDGDIKCVSSVDGNNICLTTWKREEHRIISVSTHPDDGYYSTGEPKNSVPLHSVEVDFYLYRSKTKSD